MKSFTNLHFFFVLCLKRQLRLVTFSWIPFVLFFVPLQQSKRVIMKSQTIKFSPD